MVTESVYKKVIENINEKEKQDVSELNKVVLPPKSYHMDYNILTELSQDDFNKANINNNHIQDNESNTQSLIKILQKRQSVLQILWILQ